MPVDESELINLKEYLKDSEQVEEVCNAIDPNSSRNVLGRGHFGVVVKARVMDKTIAVKILNMNLHHNQNAVSVVHPVVAENHNIENSVSAVHPAVAENHNTENSVSTVHPAVAENRSRGNHLPSRLPDNLIREYETLKLISHPFIVEYYNFHLDFERDKLFILTEYCEENNLLESKDKFTDVEIPKLFAQICLGLSVMHHRKILHRDLKPQNILLTRSHHIRIADFGLAKSLDLSISKTGSILGTPEYMAPEIFQALQMNPINEPVNIEYGYEVDIWSLACVLYFLAIRQNAFEYNMETKVREYRPLPSRPHITEQFTNLFNSMLQVEPESRPSIDIILKNEYLVDALRDIEERFPQLNSQNIVSLEPIQYEPRIVDTNNDNQQYWTRMNPVQMDSNGRFAEIKFSEFPESILPLVRESWRKMVEGSSTEQCTLYLPRVRLPLNAVFGGYLVDIWLLRNKPKSPNIRVAAKYAPSPFITSFLPPFECQASIKIQCSADNERTMTLLKVSLPDSSSTQSWFSFPNFGWRNINSQELPTVLISFSP